MKKYKIFLASSAELNDDKDWFAIFINSKNKEFHSQKVFFELLTWKDIAEKVSSTGKQNEYNEIIKDVDIFVVLVHTKIGQYTREEFDTAFNQFISTKGKTPVIYTYFKKISNEERQEIKDFKNQLNSIGHYYSEYNDHNELSYRFDEQLKKLVKDGYIKVNSFNVLTVLRYVIFLVLLPIILVVLTFKYLQSSKPFDLTVVAMEVNGIESLPYEEGELTVFYGKKKEVIKFEEVGVLKDIPARYRGVNGRIIFKSSGFEVIDTVIRMHDNLIRLPIYRDKSLSRICGVVKNSRNEPLSKVEITVKNITVRTDNQGRFKINIPIQLQQQEQRLTAWKKGYQLWDYHFPVIEEKDVRIILNDVKN